MTLNLSSNILALRKRQDEENRRIEEYNLAEKARAEDEANLVRERKDDRRYVASMVLGIFGLLASVYGIILTLRAI